MLINKQLYLNGVLVDLPPETVIAITVQDYNPLTPDTIRITYSNRIRIPFTALNTSTLQLLNNLKSTSQLYKTVIPARYVQNGIELIPNGYVKLFGTGTNYFDCALYNYGLDLFGKLGGRLLIDLDYKDVNGTVMTGAAGDFNKLSSGGGGFYAGKVTMAAADLGGNVVGYAAPNITIAQSLTYFGYQAMIEKILTQAGYSWDYGTFGLYDPAHATVNYRYSFLSVVQGNKVQLNAYSDRFRQSVEFLGQNSLDQVFSAGLGTSKVLFDTTIISCPFWNLASDRYEVTNADTASNYFLTNFKFDCAINLSAPGGTTARIMIFKNGGMIGFTTVGVGLTNTSVTATTTLKNGDYIEIFTDASNVINNITIKAGCSFFNNTSFGYSGAGYIYYNELLPEGVTQIEIIKDMLFRFGQIPKQQNNKIYFKYLSDIVNDQSNIIDWSDKRDPYTPDRLQFSLTQLAQKNTFRYTVSDDGVSDRYGEGQYLMDDGTLPLEKVSVSKIIASEDVVFNNLNWIKIPVMSTAVSNQEYAKDPGFRLASLRTSKSYESPVKYQGLAAMGGGGYYVANFTRSETGTSGLGWQNSFNEEYFRGSSSVLARFKNAKYVTRIYNLNDLDIQSIDPHKMIYDKGDFLIFPVIKNYIPGIATEVTLLKI